MKRAEFDQKIKNKVGGLISFNSFLSTSRQADVAEIFVSRNDLDSVAILFDIITDGSISRCPFAALSHNSAIADEEEVLFSMHSIFCIQTVEEDVRNTIWRVTLSLLNVDDHHLHTLTAHIRNVIDSPTGWNRLENLMMEMGKWNTVKPLIQTSLSSSLHSKDSNKLAYIHHQLGVVNMMIGDYTTAMEHYKKSLAFRSSKSLVGLPSTHNGIGSTLEEQGQLSAALNEYQYTLSFIHKLEQPDFDALTTVLNNIAGVLQRQGKLLEALDIDQECLRLGIEHLPALHPHLGTTYANIASIYDDLNEWETALKFELKALDIEQRSLPSDHPSLAITHSNIALTFHALHRDEEALSHLHKTIEIQSKCLPSDDPFFLRCQSLLEKFKQEIQF